MISKEKFIKYITDLVVYQRFEEEYYGLTNMMLCDAPEISNLYTAGINMLTELMDLNPDDNKGFVNNIITDYLCATVINAEDAYTIEVDGVKYDIASYEDLYNFIKKWHKEKEPKCSTVPLDKEAWYKSKLNKHNKIPEYAKAIYYTGLNVNDVIDFLKKLNEKTDLLIYSDGTKQLFVVESDHRTAIPINSYLLVYKNASYCLKKEYFEKFFEVTTDLNV